MCPLARDRTVVRRIRRPVASRYSLGCVSSSLLCLSACRPGVCCIGRPPTQPSPPSLLLTFLWSCSPARCTLVPSFCLSCRPLTPDSLVGLHPHFRRYQCFPVVLATVPGYPAAVRVWNRTGWSSPGCYPENRSTHRVRGRVRTGPRFHFTVHPALAPIKYLSSDRIMTSSVRKLCSIGRSFISCFQICDPTDIR